MAQYGPEFWYDEFLITSGAISAFVLTASLVVGFGLLMIRPVSQSWKFIVQHPFSCTCFQIRALAKKILPKSGEGPSDEWVCFWFIILYENLHLVHSEMQKGFFGFTNITSSTSTPLVQAKTVIKGNGDPGYLLTAREPIVSYYRLVYQLLMFPY